MSSDLQGRNGVVFGVANKRSIAWSIAQGLHAAGMKLAITYQNERLEQEAKDLILSLPGAEAYMCDVSKDEEIARLFATLKERHGKLHTLVHSVAYAPADELKGDFVNTTREGFRSRHGCERLLADCGRARRRAAHGRRRIDHHDDLLRVGKSRPPLQRDGRGQSRTGMHGALSRLRAGKEKIRVNAISAGPIKTLAARGIAGFGDMLKSHEERAPLGRRVEVEEVGNTGVFLASDASSGITGEVIYVDCGYNIMGF